MNSRHKKFVQDFENVAKCGTRTESLESLEIAFLSAHRAGLLTVVHTTEPKIHRGKKRASRPVHEGVAKNGQRKELLSDIVDGRADFNVLNAKELGFVVETLSARHSSLTRSPINLPLERFIDSTPL